MQAKQNTTENSGLVTIDSVDLRRYAGTWYEIAKIPNRFQRKCDRNVIATYHLREDGQLDVINRCTKKDGTISEAQGIAKIEDIDSNAKLKVSFVRIFGQSLFWGDYWILGLDPDYRYAVVGEPSRKYGWILSRERELSGVTMAEIDRILRNQGYDPEKFVKTAQRVE